MESCHFPDAQEEHTRLAAEEQAVDSLVPVPQADTQFIQADARVRTHLLPDKQSVSA